MRDSPASASACAFCASKRGVRRERDVEVVAERCEPCDEHFEIATEERFAARDSELLHAELDEHARHLLDLLERQQLTARQEAVVVPEDLLRHAVDAPEVAAIRDGDPQVAHGPSEGVGDAHPEGA